VTALIIATFKKPKAETYTQYLKRVSGVSRIQARPGAQAPNIPTTSQPSPQKPPPIPSPSSSPSTAQGWILQGSNPESGKNPNIHFKLTLEQFQHYGGEVTIGRKPGAAHLVIDNTSISKTHAIIAIENKQLTVKDNDSSNGTKVNDSRITPGRSTTLKNGDKLQLGEVSLTVCPIS